MFMRRVVLVALLFTLSAIPLIAQRGHGGVRMGFGGRVTIGGHAAFGGPRFSGGVFVGRRIGPPGFVRFHRRFFYGYPFGYGYGYPYYAYPAYDFFGSSYDDSYQNYDRRAYQQNQQLSQQVYNLDSQVRELRDQNDQLRYEMEKRSYAAVRPPAESVPQRAPERSPEAAPVAAQAPAAVFVFKSGVTLDTYNYAIVGQTLWVLSPQRALKYGLSQLDYDATKKANADRGVEVALPASTGTSVKPSANTPSAMHGD